VKTKVAFLVTRIFNGKDMIGKSEILSKIKLRKVLKIV
jgi:hypothetical protein